MSRTPLVLVAGLHRERTARAAGWAVSEGEVIPGVRSLSAPVQGAAAAAAVVWTGQRDDEAELGAAVVAVARAIAADL